MLHREVVTGVELPPDVILGNKTGDVWQRKETEFEEIEPLESEFWVPQGVKQFISMSHWCRSHYL